MLNRIWGMLFLLTCLLPAETLAQKRDSKPGKVPEVLFQDFEEEIIDLDAYFDRYFEQFLEADFDLSADDLPEHHVSIYHELFDPVMIKANGVVDEDLTEKVLMMYYCGKVGSNDEDLSKITEEELERSQKYRSFQKHKREMMNNYISKNGGWISNNTDEVQGSRVIRNTTELNVWYTYRMNKAEAEVKRNGKLKYDTKFDITIYAQNASDEPMYFVKDDKVASFGVQNRILLDRDPRAKKPNQDELTLKPGEAVYSTSSITLRSEKKYITDIVITDLEIQAERKEGLFPSSYSERDIEEILARIEAVEGMKESRVDRAESFLLNYAYQQKEYQAMNYQGSAEKIEDGQASIILYYYQTKADLQSGSFFNLKVDVFLNGKYLKTLKKGNKLEILMSEPGEYRFVAQRAKKAKEHQFTGKVVDVKLGHRYYFMLLEKKIDGGLAGSILGNKGVPQLYSQDPEDAKEKMESFGFEWQEEKVVYLP